MFTTGGLKVIDMTDPDFWPILKKNSSLVCFWKNVSENYDYGDIAGMDAVYFLSFLVSNCSVSDFT